ncbi:unnamed protein product [Schistosoma margrebowiei]|uniref:Uncharacterized protein n=1 Tax=Schistosoma margrebowiei TaxID=48269 RepID=A0A183N9S7_9TREM|nr:unnamed protein product [Schistosoma margrebowiei]
MKISTSEGKHGTQWTAQNQLDDSDLADELNLLSHTHEQMQIKTASVAAVSASVGLSIHKDKSKVLKYNMENSNPITLDGEALKYAFASIYTVYVITVMKNSCKRPGCRFAVTSGMQCDNCKGVSNSVTLQISDNFESPKATIPIFPRTNPQSTL